MLSWTLQSYPPALTATVEHEHEDENEHGVRHGQVAEQPPVVAAAAADPVARAGHGELRGTGGIC